MSFQGFCLMLAAPPTVFTVLDFHMMGLFLLGAN